MVPDVFPFSFAARSSKNKDEESLNQEAKVEPQAKAESKPEGERMARPAGFLLPPSSPVPARGCGCPLASPSQVAGVRAWCCPALCRLPRVRAGLHSARSAPFRWGRQGQAEGC